MIVDLAIVGFVGTFVWRGLRRGLVLSLAGFVGFFFAAAAAVFGYPLLAPVLTGIAKVSSGMASLLAALVIFVGFTVGFMLAGRALTKLLRLTKWGALNAAGGAALSGLWALSWVTAVVLAVSVLPLSPRIDSHVRSSALASGIAEQAPGWLGTIARTDLRDMLELFVPEQTKVSITATTDFERAPGAERRLFDLLNEERTARDLPPLRWDEGAARAARAHAADMYRRGYFGHESPEGRTPGDRLRRHDVRFAVTGENLALAPSSSIAHNRLMASERHRAHILDERFTRVGIGVMYGRQGLLIAQTFAG